jgi:hypothetical protein
MQLGLHNAAFLDMRDLDVACVNAIGEEVNCPGSSEWFVGFVGLNNGNGTGSMDSWWSHGRDHEIGD